MSEDKQVDNDPERTLITLDQLSQTIEVMTSVVNRLRQHLSEQLKAQATAQLEAEQAELAAAADLVPEEQQALREQIVQEIQETQESKQAESATTDQKKESFVVEIRNQDSEPVRKNGKILH